MNVIFRLLNVMRRCFADLHVDFFPLDSRLLQPLLLLPRRLIACYLSHKQIKKKVKTLIARHVDVRRTSTAGKATPTRGKRRKITQIRKYFGCGNSGDWYSPDFDDSTERGRREKRRARTERENNEELSRMN